MHLELNIIYRFLQPAAQLAALLIVTLAGGVMITIGGCAEIGCPGGFISDPALEGTWREKTNKQTDIIIALFGCDLGEFYIVGTNVSQMLPWKQILGIGRIREEYAEAEGAVWDLQPDGQPVKLSTANIIITRIDDEIGISIKYAIGTVERTDSFIAVRLLDLGN